ncbi:hypothetical protein HK100_000179 [Physocladia obscura]|uniref:cellulase n=1 Tax=Physocladia obscura TaxID=109957 RepID=A0AAD5T8W8_9FUNG|nr:hypothetical protein HK100_000179 [Physocladia obscura]
MQLLNILLVIGASRFVVADCVDSDGGSTTSTATANSGPTDSTVTSATAEPSSASTLTETTTSSTSTPTATSSPSLQYLGLDESCLEFGSGKYPGVYGTDYTSPNPVAMKNANGQFANLFRISFAWERVQPALNGTLDPFYFSLIDGAVQTATNLNSVAVLNPHNYAKYRGTTIGTGNVTAANLANLWVQLADIYKNNSLVWFGLMNEPNSIDATTWFDAAQLSINAIRETGATNVITVPGNCWTGAHSWVSGNCDITPTANAVAALAITDPADNSVFEMHQYFDVDFSGSHDSCVNNYTTLIEATQWLRINNKKGYLAEFAGASNEQCETVVSDVLAFLTTNADVWVAAGWWAGGPWWGSYMFSVESDGITPAPDAVMIPILGQYKVGGESTATATTSTTSAVQTTSTATSSPPTNLPDLVIYDGGSSLSGDWQNWSWNTDLTFNYTEVPPPTDDGAFLASSSNWGGISFYLPESFNQYSTFAFFASSQNISYTIGFSVSGTGYSSPTVTLQSACVGTLSSIAFVSCSVDLLADSPSSYPFDRVNIQSQSAGNQTIVLSDLYFSTVEC